jgi:hypothetical protein
MQGAPFCDDSKGHWKVRPYLRVRSVTLSDESTELQASAAGSVLKPWQSWGVLVRYVIACLAGAIPSGLMVWLLYMLR